MALPVEDVELDDYQKLTELLLTVPATIDEINAVRKHVDPLKGGGMRKCAARAGAFISLVLSDVPVTKTLALRAQGDYVLWDAGGDEVTCAAIGVCGSLSQAARDLGLSYRRAWNLLDDLNHAFAQPVVATATGGAHGGGAGGAARVSAPGPAPGSARTSRRRGPCRSGST